jgi:hypothetical protein
MHAVPPPKAVSAPSTLAEVRAAAAVLWSGGATYRVTDPKTKESVLLEVSAAGGRTRLRLTTPNLVIWLGSTAKSATPTFICLEVPPSKPECNPTKAARATMQKAVLAATGPLIAYQPLIAKGAISSPRVEVTHQAGYPVGCLLGRSTAGFGQIRLCTTRGGLLTEVSLNTLHIVALSTKAVATADDLAPPT